jgi:quinol monooxygenase YgiN
MTGFIQTMELKTSRLDEIEALMDGWMERTTGKRRATRAVVTADLDRPNTYISIVEFPSYDAAMENSKLPETAEFAEQLAKLCDGPPTFRNLDVRRVEDF